MLACILSDVSKNFSSLHSMTNQNNNKENIHTRLWESVLNACVIVTFRYRNVQFALLQLQPPGKFVFSLNFQSSPREITNLSTRMFRYEDCALKAIAFISLSSIDSIGRRRLQLVFHDFAFCHVLRVQRRLSAVRFLSRVYRRIPTDEGQSVKMHIWDVRKVNIEVSRTWDLSSG